jgi:hypothetical protein
MEKLVIEIELTKEELEDFNSFIKNGCFDQAKFLKRLIIGAITKNKARAVANKKAGR